MLRVIVVANPRKNPVKSLVGRARGVPHGLDLEVKSGDFELLSKLHRGQGQLWAIRQDRLLAEVAKLPPGEPMPEAMRLEMERIDGFLSTASTSMWKVRSAIAEEKKAVPTEQLEAQLIAELISAAAQWTDEQWAAVDAARKERKR